MFRLHRLTLASVVLLVTCIVSTSLAASAYGSNGSGNVVPHDLFTIIFSNNTTADYKACG